MAEMTATERRELRALIRGRYKVMRSEVDSRYDALELELTTGVNALFQNDEKVNKEIKAKTNKILSAAMAKAQEVVQQALADNPHLELRRELRFSGYEGNPPYAEFSVKNRDRLIELGRQKLRTSLREAKRKLDKEEVDLLETIAVDALGESDAAKRILAEISSLDELMPAIDVKELEK